MRGSRRFFGPPTSSPRSRSNTTGDTMGSRGRRQDPGAGAAPRVSRARDPRAAVAPGSVAPRASRAYGTLAAVTRRIVACERCPRLREHCEAVARVKKREFRDQTYWGRPVPGFGDRQARLLIVGLAPA